MMLHTKFQGSRLCGFKQEGLVFHVLCKTNDTSVGAIFGPMCIFVNKLGREPLDDASYQIARF